ncbi:nuclear transport factor 2 family protein [Curtobacterium sp. ISL-83]|uniref:nuclear transport factor 2 family protein n=1 Tax=Curtobacterium sp. ISL-83 TaxID=2819145 RepID=UPI001BEA88F8|nr:nuclear transport factor 2 family protein [Curtobacterium sp. ISL-83]MBT2502846.1 nuclear transport factor 2 family protein [Curtobacterium sp. ISL-83]
MTTEPLPAEDLHALALAYFTKVDAGDPDLLDIFTDDAQVFFPKFGIAHGKEEITQFLVGLTLAVDSFHHDPADFVVTQSGNRVIVEGKETGVLANGRAFPDGARSGGLFCNVFEFRGSLISRVHIYADPDLAGKHDDLFAWD